MYLKCVFLTQDLHKKSFMMMVMVMTDFKTPKVLKLLWWWPEGPMAQFGSQGPRQLWLTIELQNCKHHIRLMHYFILIITILLTQIYFLMDSTFHYLRPCSPLHSLAEQCNY